MKKLSLIILLSIINFVGYASGSYTGKCTPAIVGSGFSGTTTFCAGATATALTYNYAECSSGTGAPTGVACTATWYYNTTNTTTVSGATVKVSGPTAFTSAAGANGNLPTVTPVTTTAGTYYYFCVVTWVVAGTCTSPFTTATQAITINPLPTAITGANNVCVSATITLSDASTGGTWSSSVTTDATIGSTTGIVTGVAGTTKPTITYILATGCKITTVITVNPLPTAITGTTSVCTGLTTTLADGTAGGTWSSSNTAIATIGSTHIATGIAAGTATVSYSLATGCYQTTTVTVNQSPAAISGINEVCVGATITLSDVTTSGVWSSSVTTDAAIGSVTGVVTGVAGTTTPTITYLLATGCKSTMIITVNTVPAAITGTFTVCTGLTTTLADGTAGGTWSSSNTAIATIGSTHIAVGVAAGTTTISYSLATGCYKTTTVTVNQSPAAISGINEVCVGATITLSDVTTSGVWSSSVTTDAAIGSVTGVVTGVAGTTTPTITYLLATGCKSTMIITVNTVPAAITGTFTVCTGLTTTLADGTAGGTWSSSNTAIATIGSTHIAAGVAAGTTTISYSLATGCYKTTTVTVNQTPSAINGANEVCVGLTITLSDVMTGGTWSSSNNADATIGATSGIVTGVVGPKYPIITYTGTNGCVSTETITVNANPTAVLGASSVCENSTTILSDATTGGTWTSTGSINIITTGSNSGTVTGGSSAGTGTVTYTIGTGCQTTLAYTVTANPTAILGTLQTCVGAVTILSDATSGTSSWTSSNTAVATCAGADVTGKAGGTTTITYKITSGCYTTTTVTVVPTSAAISGANVVCSNATMTLSDASSGASWISTWTSSNTSVATVGSTGIVSGVSQGITTITFSTGCGANVTHATTVNPAPGAINGNNNVCVGLTMDLSDITTGGTWASSNAAIATVNSTGIVTGVAVGTSTISYTAAGCFVTSTEIINSIPATVTVSGGGTICNSTTLTASNGGSGTIYFQNTTSGGTSISIPSASEVENTSGTYYFRAESSAGCWSAQGSAAVTINVLPAISNISNLCPGNTITLSDASTGGTWSSSNTAIVTIGSNTGVVSGIEEGTSMITYTLGTGCNATSSITVNSSPTVATGTIASITKGVTSTALHFYTTGAPTNYNIAWCSAAHTAGFSDIVSSPLDTLAQDTVLHITIPSTAAAATYTGTLSVTSTGCTSNGSTIRAIITDSLNIYTFAGNGVSGYSGNGNAATIAQISHPSSVASDCNGNTYIADYDNGVIRKVDARGVITTFAGNGTIGYSGDGGPATAAKLSNPTGVAIDGYGNIYISDYSNMVVRMVNTSGIISTFAGNGGHGYSGDGGAATSAKLNYPVGLAIDNANNVYIADYLNSAIRMVNTAGIITTVAGNGTAGYDGDGGDAIDAKLNYPRGVAVDASENIYIADYSNNVIRKVNNSGIISTIAGIGIAGYAGDGGNAILAQLNNPWGITVDGYKNIYFSELHNNIIRKIDSNGIISTIAGSSCACDGYSGDGGEAINAKLDQPMGIAINCSGNLFIADNANFAVRILGTYNRAPFFAEGTTQTLNAYQSAPTTALNSLLSVTDFDTLQTETWTIAANASNGTLSISYATTSTGSTLIPSGLTYTPAPGYTGLDSFTIQVSDGTATATTTIYVTVSESAGRLASASSGNAGNTTANSISLQVYPNPTRGNFNIKTSGAGTFYLFSMDGQNIGEYTVTDQQAVVNMPTGLPSGIYIGRFKDNDGNTTDVKLVYEQ